MDFASQKSALFISIVFSCLVLLLGLSVTVFSGSIAWSVYYQEQGSASEAAAGLDDITNALQNDPYEARIWVQLAHHLKQSDRESSEIEGALRIAEMLSPALKYDIARHRTYLLEEGEQDE